MMKRFWAKVNKTNGCWLWTGSRKNTGYGQWVMEKKNYLAHRYSWQIHNGDIPAGLCVCHKCDMPLCVNPDHLFLGTQAENMRDMKLKGRSQTGPRKNPYKRYPDWFKP